MSKWVVDIHGDIEGDYEIIKKYEEPKTGKWIDGGTEEGAFGFVYTRYRCSCCGWEHSLLIPKNYCPNCGAKMEVEE